MNMQAIASPATVNTDVALVNSQSAELSSTEKLTDSVATSIIMQNGEITQATKTINGEVQTLTDEEAKALVERIVAQTIFETALTELFLSTFSLPFIEIELLPEIENDNVPVTSPQVEELSDEIINQPIAIEA